MQGVQTFIFSRVSGGGTGGHGGQLSPGPGKGKGYCNRPGVGLQYNWLCDVADIYRDGIVDIKRKCYIICNSH